MSRRFAELAAENPGATKRDVLGMMAPEYKDGMTKQSFKDDTDVNRLLQKMQKTNSLRHVDEFPESVYREFDGEMDLLTADARMKKANRIFERLPSEVRREFDNNPLRFVTYAASLPPGELVRKIPQIAEPGRFFPNPISRGGQGAGAATAPASAGGASTQATPEGGSAQQESSDTGDSGASE